MSLISDVARHHLSCHCCPPTFTKNVIVTHLLACMAGLPDFRDRLPCRLPICQNTSLIKPQENTRNSEASMRERYE
jgi:hypothetical protein